MLLYATTTTINRNCFVDQLREQEQRFTKSSNDFSSNISSMWKVLITSQNEDKGEEFYQKAFRNWKDVEAIYTEIVQSLNSGDQLTTIKIRAQYNLIRLIVGVVEKFKADITLTKDESLYVRSVLKTFGVHVS